MHTLRADRINAASGDDNPLLRPSRSRQQLRAPDRKPQTSVWGFRLNGDLEGWTVGDVAAAFGLPLPALVAVAVAALAGRLDLAVAHLREAPTSSASSSVTDRLSPSGVSSCAGAVAR